MTAYRIVTWCESRWNWWARIERPLMPTDPASPFTPIRSSDVPDIEDGWKQVDLCFGVSRRQANRKADRRVRELQQGDPSFQTQVRAVPTTSSWPS